VNSVGRKEADSIAQPKLIWRLLIDAMSRATTRLVTSEACCFRKLVGRNNWGSLTQCSSEFATDDCGTQAVMLYRDKQCKVDSTTSRDESSLNLVNDCNGCGYNNERASCGAVAITGGCPENNSESFNIVLEMLTR